MNIVFLDIDGVLQPYNSGYRFLNVDKTIIEKLSILYNTDYSRYDFWDVAAVYYDWDEQAVARLKYILNETNSKIIISSNWRSKTFPNKMIDLLKIHNLDNYWIADNIIFDYQENNTLAKRRSKEINHSLEKYNIKNFVILDDEKELEIYFPNNSVITHNIIEIKDMKKCIKILKF